MPFVYAAWLFLANVVSARSMKLMTRASRAPGVSSVGMICAAMASTSSRLIWREEPELHRPAGLRRLQHVVFGCENARIVRRDPGSAEPRHGIKEKRSS